MISSQQHFEKAVEMLISRNIEVVRHFSPYDESGRYEAGSALQVFWDNEDKRYMFVFDKNGECTWSSFGD